MEKISIVTNGSLVKKDFFKKYGKYVDVFGVSCDSFDKETNIKIGRGTKGENVKRSTLSAQLNGNSAVSAETITLFLKKFKTISAEWLVRGIGNMFCPGIASDKEVFDTSSVCGNETANETANGGDIKDERIKLLEEKIAFLEEQVDFYKNKA